MQITKLSLLIGVEIGEEEWLMDSEENTDQESGETFLIPCRYQIWRFLSVYSLEIEY